jgi:large subunit ribosomal protein L22
MAMKTNELPGTRAVLRYCPMSSYKAREVLDLIRGEEYQHALDILRLCDRGAATVIEKLLRSAGANAEHNDVLDLDELYVASCFADEGTTLKRWRPRARGRATRIRKRTCHITIILARLPEDRLARRRARAAADAAERRARRVAGTRRRRRSEDQPSTPSELSSPQRRNDRLVKDVALDDAAQDTSLDVSDGATPEELGTEANDVVAPWTDESDETDERAPDGGDGQVPETDSAVDKDES